ncbi:MAG: N-methyl-L-tryptophan oxidase [Thermomicrobiales bacterium]
MSGTHARLVDIAVIGGGVMGCAAAYHLARDGHRVLLFERFAVGHDRGSSHGPSRIIRLAYDGADYVRLAETSYALWRELEAESGESLLHPMGGLDFGSPDSHLLAGIRATYDALGVPYDSLNRAEIVRRFPQFNPPEDAVGYFQPDYAILAADRCVATLATQARQRGATIREHEPVQAITPTASGVRLQTAQGVYSADRVILTAGSWTRPLLRQLGLDLPLSVTNEVIAFYRPSDPAAYAPGRFPLFVQHFPGTTSIGSGFPLFNHEGVKLMLDRTGPVVDPDDPDRGVDTGGLDLLRAYVAEILPALGDDIIETVTCRYTMTPDEDFILDRHPSYPQVLIASPCSGHGFKFAVAIGRIVAGLAIDGATEYDISRFRLDRPALATGQPWSGPLLAGHGAKVEAESLG